MTFLATLKLKLIIPYSILFKDVNDNLVCNSSTQIINQSSVKKFLQVLALCHTVQVAPKKTSKSTKNLKKSLKRPDEIVYNASSPDEKAIVEACRNYGVTFLGEKEMDQGKIFSKIFINQEGTGRNCLFERLQVLEFDSDRKRMSVIVKEPKGSIRLVTKGAEVTVLPKCTENTSNSLLETTKRHIDLFATEGLRTLAVAVKTLSLDEYQDFKTSFTKASQSLENRELKIRQVYEDLESGLELIGAIGVEDKLQEGVKDTLVALGQAGIKVWILTGDKKETARNISWSCGHLRPDMHLIDITGLESPQSAENTLKHELSNLKSKKSHKSLCLIGKIQLYFIS